MTGILTALLLATALPRPAEVLRIPWITSGTADPGWGTGIQPQIDCSNYAGGDWVCTGATLTAAGTPATATSPLFPVGFGAAAWTGATFDGVDDVLHGGDVGDCTGDHWHALVFSGDVATNSGILAKYDTDTVDYSYLLYDGAGTMIYSVFKSAVSSTGLTFAAMQLRAINVLVVSYDYVADGTSILRGNLNGTAPAEVTTAVGPVQDTAAGYTLGAYSDAVINSPFTGRIFRATTHCGTALTAVQAAGAVATMRSQIGMSREAVTITRASNEPFQPTTASNYFDQAQNVISVTSTGTQIYPAIASLLPLRNDAYDNAVWVPENSGAGATVVTPGQADGWDGQSLTADQIAVAAVTDNDADYSAICQEFTATAAKWRIDLSAKTASGTANPYLYAYNGATYYSTQCAFTTAYSWCGLTTAANLTAATWKVCVGTDSRDAAQTTTAANTLLAWRSTLYAGQFRPAPYQVAGVAVVVPTTTASTNNVLQGGPQDWCVYAEAKKAGSWATPVFDLWSMGTTGTLNTATLRFLGDGNIYGYTYDGTGAVYCSAAHGLTTDDSVHKFVFCNAMGTMTIWIDGANKALSCAGGNTGIMQTMPASLHIGHNGVGANVFGGTIRNVIQCPHADPARCPS